MQSEEQTAYIELMSKQLGIDFPASEMPRVKGVLANLERLAGMLRDTPMDDGLIAAAVFRHPFRER